MSVSRAVLHQGLTVYGSCRNVMSVFAIEVARVLSERSLEISFANALSSVASGVGEDDTVLDLEAALQVTLQTLLVRTRGCL